MHNKAPISFRTRYAFRWDRRAGWLSGLMQGLTLPFFGVIARRMGASELEISLLIAAPFCGHLLSMFVAWHMQNRAKKPYMFWLGILSRIPLLLMAFVTRAPLFIAIVIAVQFIGCFMAPAYASMMKDVYPDHVRGQLMGWVRALITVAMMCSGLLAGRLLEKGLPLSWVLAVAGLVAVVVFFDLPRTAWRWLPAVALIAIGFVVAPFLAHPATFRLIFPLAGLAGLGAAWAFNHLPEAKASGMPSRRFSVLEGVLTLKTDWRFGLYSLAFFTFGFGNLLQSPLIPLFQVDEMHITDLWVGLLATVGAGTSALFYIIWGRVMDRYNPFYTAVFSFAVWGISPLVYAYAHSVPTLLIASVIIGIASPGIDLAWLNAVMQFAGRDSIPRYTATHTFLVGIRGLVGPFVGAWLLSRFNLRQCFHISAAVIWVGAALMAWVVFTILLPDLRKGRWHAGEEEPVAVPVT